MHTLAKSATISELGRDAMSGSVHRPSRHKTCPPAGRGVASAARVLCDIGVRGVGRHPLLGVGESLAPSSSGSSHWLPRRRGVSWTAWRARGGVVGVGKSGTQGVLGQISSTASEAWRQRRVKSLKSPGSPVLERHRGHAVARALEEGSSHWWPQRCGKSSAARGGVVGVG